MRTVVRHTFSLTPKSSALMRAIAEADERPMSAQLRQLIRARAYELAREDSYLSPPHRRRIQQILETPDEVDGD